ncbi:MAG: TrkH family potassium uptake protein [Alphaproteobacteria bacterium]|nr:TrkH family potassium uptake protein [Alphaproteobacteria bacterium]
MRTLRPILFAIGAFLLVLGLAMLLPAALDYALGNREWSAFLASAALTLFTGGALVLANRAARAPFTIEQGFILTFTAWATMCAFAALPFVFAETGLTLADAVFEATSGLTTTGATVISGLDAMPEGILLWRMLLHGIGGIGIIVLAVAILPALRIGGLQLLRLESSDKSEKTVPRIADIAWSVSLVYTALVFACFLAYWAGGMSGFDAICHALSTVSTGGFANYDASFGHFGPHLQYTAVLFMIAGGLPMLMYWNIARGKAGLALSDPQILVFLGVLGVAAFMAGVYIAAAGLHEGEAAVRHAVFNVTSIVTTTGFATDDYSRWGPFMEALFYIITFSGACAGSTSGGVKAVRTYVVAASLWTHMKRIIHPHGVFVPRFGGRPVSGDVTASVFAYFFFFFLITFAISLAVAMMGLDLKTALSVSAATLTNVGPALGPIAGPAGNYGPLPDGVIWLLSFAMLLGRLELFTVLVLINPWFWRN